jgi:hypothetical protein
MSPDPLASAPVDDGPFLAEIILESHACVSVCGWQTLCPYILCSAAAIRGDVRDVEETGSRAHAS